MTTKDFALIADALAASRPDLATAEIRYAGWHAAYMAIADTLARDNPRFDRVKFRWACAQ